MYIDIGVARDENRWQQIAKDLVAPAHESDWTRNTTDRRITDYDQVRPFATRGALVAAMALLFGIIPGTSHLAWLLLLPAVLQTVLEIVLEARQRSKDAPTRDDSLLSPFVQLWYRNYELWQINPTGLLGAVAVPCNIAAAVFFTGSNTYGPAKVAAFACAVLYLSSGVSGPLLDATVYSPLQRTPQLLRRLRPMIWLAFVLFLVAVVAASQAWAAAWPPDALPYAYMVCLLPYAIGLRIREYERALGSGGVVVANAQSEATRQVSQDMHELLQKFKGPLHAAMDLEGLDPSSRMGLVTFMNTVEVIYDRARNRKLDLQSGIMPPLEDIVRNICAPASIKPTTSIQIEGLDVANHGFATQLISTLTNNAVQAYERDFDMHVARIVDVRAFVEGDRIHVVVTDALDPIPEDIWCLPHSNLGYIRETLRQHDGTLSQVVLEPAGKSIQAVWSARLPTLRNESPPAPPSDGSTS